MADNLIMRFYRQKPFIILCSVFLLQWAFLFNSHQGTWDGGFYYAYARSITFDFDLDLVNDLTLSYPTSSPDFVAKSFETHLTKTGRVETPFAIGTGLFWAPWLGILHLVNQIAILFGGGWEQPTGYEWLFVGGTAIFSAITALLAIGLAYKVSEEIAGKKTALASAITLMFTTSLIHYQFRQPFYSHAASAFTTALCIYIWRQHQRHQNQRLTITHAAILGSAIGFAALVRWQHITYAILPVFSVIFWWKESDDNNQNKWRQAFTFLCTAGLAALAFLSVQLAFWRLFFGNWLTVPQGSAFLNWTAPFVLQVLFSTYHGLFTWSPVALVAILGLVLTLRKQPRLVIPLLCIFILETYVNGSTVDWFGGGGYGPRRYISETAIFVIGYAAFLNALPQKARRYVTISLGALLFLHQWILLRYGISEKIGGKLLSMSPTFKWVDQPVSIFLQTIVGYLPTMLSNTVDVFVFPSSPLFLYLQNDGLPWPNIITLLLTAVFIFSCYTINHIWNTRRPPSAPEFSLLIPTTILVIIAFNLWILNWA